jgi:hypothetical protein
VIRDRHGSLGGNKLLTGEPDTHFVASADKSPPGRPIEKRAKANSFVPALAL